MRMEFTWHGCDSALAAPLVLDLARLTARPRTRPAGPGRWPSSASSSRTRSGDGPPLAQVEHAALCDWAAGLGGGCGARRGCGMSRGWGPGRAGPGARPRCRCPATWSPARPRPAGRSGRRTAGLAGASVCLYWAGMAANDWADRELDAVERPRAADPVRAGPRRPRRSALAAGLTAAGLGAGRGGRRPPRARRRGAAGRRGVGVRPAAKNTAAGPAVMAACRALDVLLGASAGRPRRALPAALTVAAHTYTVTALSAARGHRRAGRDRCRPGHAGGHRGGGRARRPGPAVAGRGRPARPVAVARRGWPARRVRGQRRPGAAGGGPRPAGRHRARGGRRRHHRAARAAGRAAHRAGAPRLAAGLVARCAAGPAAGPAGVARHDACGSATAPTASPTTGWPTRSP